MIRNLCFLSLICVFIIACSGTKEENEYFYTKNEEITLQKNKLQGLNEIYLRELHKYDETKEKKYLISSKYVKVRLLRDKRDEQLKAIYELLKINDNEYNYITTTCNYYLAIKFEKSLPQSSLIYISNAIAADEKSSQQKHLPHLYHFKGRLLYNLGKYNEAVPFFLKAMEIHQKREEMLFVASMHNNIGMCYEKQGDTKKAIAKTILAIELLNRLKNSNQEENSFKNQLKGRLAEFYRKEGNDHLANKLFSEEWKYAIENKDIDRALDAAEGLVYADTSLNVNSSSKKQIIDSLDLLKNFLQKPNDRLKFYELKYDYYSKFGNDAEYKKVAESLVQAVKYSKDYMNEERERNYEATDKTIVENFDSQFVAEKKKTTLLIFCVGFVVVILFLSVILLVLNKRKKIDLIKKDMIIAEQEKNNLEENLKFQNEKLKNFHLMLNVKTETEKSFIESLKKIRKSKNVDIEEALKDLHLRINNAISLDSKSLDFVNESSEENTVFKNSLAEKFPVLTKNDLKFCVYFRLGLASKEISLLEKVTEASVRVYKTKIKTKMMLDKSMSLTTYLQEF